MTTGRSTDAAAGAVDPILWASTLDEMAYGDRLTGISEDQTSKTSVRTDFPVITPNR